MKILKKQIELLNKEKIYDKCMSWAVEGEGVDSKINFDIRTVLVISTSQQSQYLQFSPLFGKSISLFGNSSKRQLFDIEPSVCTVLLRLQSAVVEISSNTHSF